MNLFAVALPIAPAVVLPIIGLAVLASAGVFVYALIKHQSAQQPPASGGTPPGGLLGGILSPPPAAPSAFSGLFRRLTHLGDDPFLHLIAAAGADRLQDIGKATGHAFLDVLLSRTGLTAAIPAVNKIADSAEAALVAKMAQQQPTAPAPAPQPTDAQLGDFHKFLQAFNEIRHKHPTGTAA